MAKMHPARQFLGRFLATGLIAAHLFIVSLAASPALHHWVHGDADEPDHSCAVTALIDGHLDRPDALCLRAAQPLPSAEFCEPAAPNLYCSAFFRASPGERAPPRA